MTRFSVHGRLALLGLVGFLAACGSCKQTSDGDPDIETDTGLPDVIEDTSMDTFEDTILEDTGADAHLDSAEEDPILDPVEEDILDVPSEDVLEDDGPPTVAGCFSDVFTGSAIIGPDYDQFDPVVGSHCFGTNHQDITGVERVVFVGDSVTVGTPPTAAADFYRSRLADELAARFGLTPPNMLWKNVNPIDGVALVQESGDFASCAKWGARNDDLMRDNDQIEACIPESERHKTHLVIMTSGGNDISSITQMGIDGIAPVDIWPSVIEFVDLMESAITWFYEDPLRFPGGVYVVFANMFEFTDGTGDVTACPAAGLAGFGAEWDDPDALADMVIWANEQYARIAVDTDTDVIFILEHFCGHGFNADNPTSPCYRGPGTEQWFDLTCIHPNPTGHAQLADMFMAVVEE